MRRRLTPPVTRKAAAIVGNSDNAPGSRLVAEKGQSSEPRHNPGEAARIRVVFTALPEFERRAAGLGEFMAVPVNMPDLVETVGCLLQSVGQKVI